MRKKTSLVGILIALFLISIISWHSVNSAEEPKSTPTPAVEVELEEINLLADAVSTKILGSQRAEVKQTSPNVELENINITADVSYATGWIIRKDPETGDLMPSEPGIFIAERAGNEWKIYLPSDHEWTDKVRSFPQDLISINEKNRILGMDVNFGAIEEIETDGGYLLPWAAGKTIYLSRSISHDEDFPSGNAHYSFDFYYPQTMFNLYAAKAGTVWSFKDTVPNNDHSDVNFFVLRNADNPNLYQLYLHLAQGSIPPSLKSIGAQVIQGQFVGIADNTGASTGHHLHFQVQTLPYWPVDNPYWGKSVDITFNEVEIYGGRPRRTYEYDEEICGGYCEDGLQAYISANTLKGDLTPPIGNFDGVMMGQIVETPTLFLNGWGADAQSGLYSGQLRALYDGAWHILGSTFNNNFSYTWDLCANDNPVPKGVVSVGLRLYDWDGNWADYAGLKHFIKDFDCAQAPPVCSPGADQVALFENIDFGGGCVIFDEGSYSDAQSLGALGNNDAASIKIGSSAQATLYSEEGYVGHSETFTAGDNNFIDNLIGLDTLSSLKVGDKSGSPGVPITMGPPSGASFSEEDFVPLSWKNGDNSVEYQVRYTLSGEPTIILDWQSAPFSYLSALSPGDYAWQVRARNQNDVTGSWSELASFEILPASNLPSSFNAPYTDNMETSEGDWVSSGIWDLKSDSEKSYSGIHSWWYEDANGDYDNGMPNYGNLTSPPIYLPTSGYFLRFWYRYETETKGLYWDQRWLQISVNGDAFTSIFQLQDDPQTYETSSWLQSKVFDLSEFAGDTLRFRFYFASMDASMNDGQGWGIDDFSITSTPPSTCDEDQQGETPEGAFNLSYSETQKVQGEICPGGDYDFYRFEGSAGDQVVIDIDAQTIESPLDSYLVLVDSDGRSLLAEHDDEVYAEQRDPLLTFTLTHDGEYFIKLRAWKHPSAGGDDHDYTIRLYKDNNDPYAFIINPVSDSYIPLEPFDVVAQVNDAVDGISHVDFFWHDYDWVIPSWELIDADWDASDGWSISFDPSGLLERDGGAFYIDAYDKAGNLAVAGIWNIGVDLTPPTTNLEPLDADQESSALQLSWDGSDYGSGLAFSNLQFKLDGGVWQTYPDEIYDRGFWFIGDPGHAYEFRIRGVDRAGNLEDYPGSAQASSMIPSPGILCSAPDLFDSGGGDNTSALANPIDPNGGTQIHNFCNTQTPDRMNDEDWMKFNVQNGIRYLIRALPLGGNAGMVLELFAEDATTLIRSVKSSRFGSLVSLEWNSDRNGEVFLRVHHLDGRVIGNKVAYSVSVVQGYSMYFPLLRK